MGKSELYKNNFIRQIIDKDLLSGKHVTIHTRFPPEPNGYLHIGHAKSICLNFGLAYEYSGKCNLRFDDTNPTTENSEFIESIKDDIKWLGFNWNGNIRYSSDYFNQIYEYAIELIEKGLAYVDELSIEKIREYRGTLTSPGKNSPYRNRSINKNLELFTKMHDGGFTEGSACLRAKIDMSSSFIIMRDPVLYRVKFAEHHQTGKKWCIYPMYDFAHCIADSIENITHSICTLEFQDNRRLYDWVLNNLSIKVHPKQYEFSRLNLEFSVTSKRKLNKLVSKKVVDGWDDPRMPSIAGLRRRGYTASAIRDFCFRIGVTKQEQNIEISALEACIREDLNKNSPRFMAVLDPVKIVIDSLPEGYEKDITMYNHPNNLAMGTRKVAFSREIYIDRSDFCIVANKKFKRLVLGKQVRLRNAYIIKAESIEQDKSGKIIIIHCSYDANTLNKNPVDGHKVKGVIHWVSATRSVNAEFHLYDKLFITHNPSASENFLENLNPDSLLFRYGFVESGVLNSKLGSSYQFEREGYFCADSRYFTSVRPVFNRTVNLKDKRKTKTS